LRVTVNTDNRLVSDTTLTREFQICAERLGFTGEGVRDLIIDGFKSAFLPYYEKRRLLRRVVRELDDLFLTPAITRL
jgi:adenosine deaminase